MSRLPREAASRNISACSEQAIFHVGCRLMVASSANTSRPLAPAAWGDIARALATKAAMSSEADGLASGNEPTLPDAAFCVEATSPADLGLIGSPDIGARETCSEHYVGRDQAAVNAGMDDAAIFLTAPAPTTLRSPGDMPILSSGPAHRAQPARPRSSPAPFCSRPA